MKIQIWQINRKLDEKGVAFERYDRMMKITNGQPDWSIYKCVYDGDMEFEDLEDVFCIFNMRHPDGFKGHSLSVSDIVKVLNDDRTKTSYYCDSFGWKKI